MSDPAGVNSFGTRHRTRPQPKARHRTRPTGGAVPAARPDREAGRAAGSSPTVLGDYDIGYGKPPKRTQFKRGQSGNPRGRPRGSKNLSTYLTELMNSPISVRIDGQSTRMTGSQALAKSLFGKALKGDPKAIAFILQMIGTSEVQGDPASSSGRDQMIASAREREAFYDLLRRYGVDVPSVPDVVSMGKKRRRDNDN